MKARLLRLAAKIDALTLRERVMVFAALAASIVFVVHFSVLGPMFRKQAALRAQISQQQNNLAGMDGEITGKVEAYAVDPDAAAKARLDAVAAEVAQLGDGLRAMQKGLVPPERIAPLLDTILRANGQLQLVSMRTLPVSSIGESALPPAPQAAAPRLPHEASMALKAATVMPVSAPAPAVAGAAAPAPAPSLLYRHGVEVTVRGNYLDMVNYMDALESMPTQLFWGRAQLEVEEYPSARLTLTLYTLSLDQKWMKL
jgi:MSHA biogenesis protein MshJ